MAQLGGYINVSTDIFPFFTNASVGDCVLYTDTPNQSIHVGGQAGSASSFLKVTKSNAEFLNSLVVANNIKVSSNVQTNGITRIGNDGGLSNVRINANSVVTGQVASIRLPTASTTSRGVVQLSNSISQTSSAIAATPTAVKSASDLAATKLPSTGGTLTGNLVIPSLSFPGNDAFRILTGISLASNVTDQTYGLVTFDNPFRLRPYVCTTPESSENSNVCKIHVFSVQNNNFNFFVRSYKFNSSNNTVGTYNGMSTTPFFSWIAVGPA